MSAIYVPETDFAEKAVYPIFSYESIENIAKSEQAGRPIFEEVEMVSVHIAGERNLVHTARTNEECGRDGFRKVTWAERFKDEYSAWKDGEAQGVRGTPLTALQKFGVTQNQISLCLARKVHTVEALMQLEGQNLKSLGMDANALKEAAREYMADRNDKRTLANEVAELRDELARLKGVALSPAPDAVNEGLGGINQKEELTGEAYPGQSDDDLKAQIAAITGARPRGNPSRATLVLMLNEAKAAQ